MSARMSSCKDCSHWQLRSTDKRIGQCRYMPPVVVAVRDSVETVFPETGESDWCNAFWPEPDYDK